MNQKITFSQQKFKDTDKEYSYKIISEKIESPDTTEFIFNYLEEENPDFKRGEVCWGETTIRFKKNQKEGSANWEPSDPNQENFEIPWTIEEIVVAEEPSNRHKRSQDVVARDQKKFRKELINSDGKCVLTGETTEEALEAAHIIPVKKGGLEKTVNGILLRADIHRLFDAKKFSFDSNGKVINIKGVSEKYKKVLQNKYLNKSTLGRVEDALKLSIKANH